METIIPDPFLYSGKEELENMECMQNYNKSIAKIIKEHIKENQTILDFGAGIGTISAYFPKEKLTCLEIDHEQKQMLKAKGFHVVESLQELEDQSICFAYSSNVLEHIEDDYQTVKDIYPKIMADGRIVFYVPAFPILYSNMDKRVGHFRRYTKKRLHDVFEKAGFKVEKIFFSDSLGFFITMLFNLIGSQDGRASKKSLIFYDRIIYPVSSLLDNVLSNIFGKNIVIVAKKN